MFGRSGLTAQIWPEAKGGEEVSSDRHAGGQSGRNTTDRDSSSWCRHFELRSRWLEDEASPGFSQTTRDWERQAALNMGTQIDGGTVTLLLEDCSCNVLWY